MGKFGFHYNVIMAADAADTLRVSRHYNALGWESYGMFYDKNGTLNVAIKKPMTEEEWGQVKEQKRLDDIRQEAKARYK